MITDGFRVIPIVENSGCFIFLGPASSGKTYFARNLRVQDESLEIFDDITRNKIDHVRTMFFNVKCHWRKKQQPIIIFITNDAGVVEDIRTLVENFYEVENLYERGCAINNEK
jgi:hypothetical protein